MDRWKAEQGRGREKRKFRRERVRRKKMQMREKVGKSRLTVFFQWFVVPEGRKVGSLKRRVRRHMGRWDMKNCTPLWREAHFQVKMHKTPEDRTTFGASDVEKVHAVVARSTSPSQNVQSTPGSDHFWKLRCRKSAHRCGAKHMSKSKCRKHTKCGPLLALKMSKKCTPLWREAHFQVKMLKTLGVRTTFGGSEVEFRKSARRCGTKHISKSKCAKHQVFEPLLEAQRSSFEKVHAAVARSTFRSQNVQTTACSDHFWRLRCRVSKKCTPLWREADLEVNMLKTLGFRTTFGGSDVASLNSITLHDTTLCCTTLHYTTLHYITLHYTSQHYRLQLQLHNYSPLQSTTLNYTALHSLHYTSLHYTTTKTTQLHYKYNYTYPTTLHYTPLHNIKLHYTTLHYTTLHNTTTKTTQLHSTTLHYLTLHYITLR